MMQRAGSLDFFRVEWGADEAKGDKRLPEYFVETPEFDDVLEGTKRYVIGRKGTGKTAVLERIRQMSEADPLLFYADLSLRSFPVQTLRGLGDSAFRDKSQFVPIWMFLFAVELARLVLQDNGASSEEPAQELAEFLRANALFEACGFVETVTRLKTTKAKVSLLPSWVVSGELGKESQQQTNTSVHYQKATDMLLERLASIQSESTYYLLMDELDEGYSAGDPGIRLLLLALLRATEDMALRLQPHGLKFRPILALRSDIFDRLEDNDLNKLDDFVARLCWTASPEGTYSLRRVVDARIKASLTIESLSAWDIVAMNHDSALPKSVDSLWSYVSTRTFERPRDLVKFLKLCRRRDHAGPLCFADVQLAENSYSDWLYRELRDEIHSVLPVWAEALQCITRIGTGIFKSDRLVSELGADAKIAAWMKDHGGTTDGIIECLFDFGVLGNLTNQGKWLFHYKDADLVWNPGMDLIVHYGFQRKLRIVQRA